MSWKPGKCICCNDDTWITDSAGNLVRPNPYKLREAYAIYGNESGPHYVRLPLCSDCTEMNLEETQVCINKLLAANAIQMPEVLEGLELQGIIGYKELWANRGMKVKPIWETLLTTSRST